MRTCLLILLVPIGGCRNDRPPTPTQEQSAQLNEAENMLNAAANQEALEANADGNSTRAP